MNPATLEQVEQMVAQLPPGERLKLAARICEELSAAVPTAPPEAGPDQRLQDRLRLAEELLAEVEDVEDDSQGEVDAAADIRRLREESVRQICPSDA